jgi:hypothetical protein
MFDQEFTYENLMKVLNHDHLTRYKFGQEEEDRVSTVKNASKRINESEFNFSQLAVTSISKNRTFMVGTICTSPL